MKSAGTKATKMKKPIAILSVLVVAALILGDAVIDRLEWRRQHDRFSVGIEPLPTRI
jgi:hypothetical protein